MKKLLASLSAMAVVCLSANAVNTFTAVSGDWNTSENWSEGVPIAGHDVVINGSVSLTNATPELASLTVNAGTTLTFDGWGTVLNAAEVDIYGTLTHAANTATTTNSFGQWVPNARVNIVCDTLYIAPTGKIDVNSKGYQGGTNADGRGPGRGVNKTGQGGGGYGGIGGGASGVFGQMYGSYLEPAEPGSGGGGAEASSAGGGHVRIVAEGSVTIDGSILASGGNTSGNFKGGGSGGGVFIWCGTILGSGSIVANGGSVGSWTASGGGGRIAVVYDEVEQAAQPLPSLWFSAAAGARSATSSIQGDVGTLYFPDSQFLLRRIGTIKHSGVWMAPGLPEWRVDSLALENAWIRIPATGFVVEVTNNFSITGANVELSRLELTNATVACGGTLMLDKGNLTLWRGVSGGTALSVGEDLLVKNGALIHVHGGMTGDIGVPGSTVDVAGDITVSGAGSWIYPYSHPTNGGSVRFTARNVFLPTAGAGFDASGRGYAGGGLGAAGYGPGAGQPSGTVARGQGGGYGGFGGYADGVSAQTNGAAAYPVGPGSGGAGATGNRGVGGAGGGAIWILAEETVQVNGSLLADGANHTETYPGAGSGGGIYIECEKIVGANGIVNARGGMGQNYGGGGGGGRIAVIYNPERQGEEDVPTIAFNAAIPAYSVNVTPGTIGTLYFPDSRFLLQAAVVRQSGRWLAPGLASPWAPGSLVLNGSWLHIPMDGFEISTPGLVSITGTDKRLSKLELINGRVSAGSGIAAKMSTLIARVVESGGGVLLDSSTLIMNQGGEGATSFDCAGGLVLTNAATFTIYSGVADGEDPHRGAEVNVGGGISIVGGSWIYPWSHPTNGGSVRFQAANVYITANSGIDAATKGFRGGRQNIHPNGYGPGAGTGTGGGGHGGLGGAAAGIYGQTYGSAIAPLWPGSGGGYNNDAQISSDGGGFVWIETPGKVVLNNGHLLANAIKSRNVGGGGSGGSILVDCASFSGDAASTLKAGGGDSGGWGSGGGGGRIAVWRGVSEEQRAGLLSGSAKGAEIHETYEGFLGAAIVTAGIGANNGQPGQPGTLAFIHFPPPATTTIIVR